MGNMIFQRFPYCQSYASLELHMSIEVKNTVLKHDFHVLMFLGSRLHTVWYFIFPKNGSVGAGALRTSYVTEIFINQRLLLFG